MRKKEKKQPLKNQVESIENIVFEDEDTPQSIARKTVLLFAGCATLGDELRKLKISYVKVQKGLFIEYILRGEEIGKMSVRL